MYLLSLWKRVQKTQAMTIILCCWFTAVVETKLSEHILQHLTEIFWNSHISLKMCRICMAYWL